MFTKSIPDAVKSDGSRVPYEPGKGYKLAAGTYYVDCSMPDAVNASTHVSWDATLIATSINIQTTGMPGYASASAPFTDNSAPADVTNITVDTAGLWLTQNPTTAYVPCIGGTVTNMTIAVGGGTAGACEFDLGNYASRRCRTKLVITTGGYLRLHTHGKMA